MILVATREYGFVSLPNNALQFYLSIAFIRESPEPSEARSSVC
jgi:hypothetical protein